MSGSDNWRPPPDVTRAHHFEAAFCEDPNCGLHIVAKYESGKPICEIVMSASQTRTLVDICKDFLYDKAVRRSDD